MLDPVQLQNMIVSKISAAYITSIWLFTGMRSRMNLQLFRTCETFSTSLHRTFVWFFTRMCSHMNNQLTRLNECLRAYTALMRTFAGMNSHMTMQFSAVFKSTSTPIAFIWTLCEFEKKNFFF